MESPKFKTLNLTELTVDGNVVGYSKAVNQVGYYELLEAGHYAYNDQAKIIAGIIG